MMFGVVLEKIPYAKIGRSLALVLIAGSFTASAGKAQSLSSDEILQSLKSKPASQPLTRSLGQKPAAQGGLKSSDSNYLKELPTRGLKIEMKSRVAEIIDHADLPSIDIEVRFDFDSAKIRDQSLPDLDALGRALSSPELSGARLLVNGHTDARGSEGYNMELSERRAESVREYLVSHYGIAGKRLVAIGFGEERLKDRHDPEAAVNRRVEIVNAGDM